MATNTRTPNIISRVRSRANSLSAQAVSDGEILDLLDEAQADLCIQLNDAALGAMAHVQTAALTLDANPYTLPARFLRETALTYKVGTASVVQAIRWPVHRLCDLANDPNLTPSESKPFYYFWDNKLWIEAGTKTAGNYALYYLRTPADLTTGTNPELDAEHDALLETFATMRCWENRAEFDEAETLWREYLDRCEVINSRHASGLPFDGIAGDRGDRGDRR